MGKVAIALVFGYFCINFGIWSVGMLGILPNFGLNAQIDPSNVWTWFSLNTFSFATGLVGGVAVGIMALITKSYLWSAGVLVVWIVGVMLGPLQDILTGLPKLTLLFLPTELSWVGSLFTAFGAFILFIFFVEVIGGKDIL